MKQHPLSFILVIASLSLLAASLTGCSSQKDLVSTGVLTPDRQDSSVVDLSIPRIVKDNTLMLISGTVTRKPGMDAVVPGHVHIQFIAKDGQILDQLSAIWDLTTLPVDGSRQTSYEIRYGVVPPPGTIVRVTYTEQPADYWQSGSGGGSDAPSTNSHYTRTPGTPISHGTPGTPRGGAARR